jgi:hypothetical protein
VRSRDRVFGAVVAAAGLISFACGGRSDPPSATPPDAAPGSCAVSIETSTIRPRARSAPKPRAGSSRAARRGQVYQELWKHEAARRARPATRSIGPLATAEDQGQIAVLRDDGDLILPANPYDLRSTAVTFERTGVGAFDLRRSDRTFQTSVGDKVALDDDDSGAITLPFVFPFYSGRYSELFINSDGNLTFVSDDHASTDRDVNRFLTGPPRIALLFDDLDPSSGGGVYRRVDGDGVLITWCSVPEFDAPANRVNVQVRVAANGNIDMIYGAMVSATSAVVGVSPGATGVFMPVDVSAAATTRIAGGSGAVGERFASQQEVDFVAATRKFYQSHGDEFDQLIVYTNTRTTSRGVFSYEFTVANEVSGIGLDIYDSSRDFGSNGRLRSIVNMDALSKFPDDPRQRFLGENNPLSIMGQECGHRWLAYLEFRDGTTTSQELLGRDQAHWSFFFDSDASNMEGNDIEDLGGGLFRTVGAVSRYSALDQYAMGLRAANEVPPMFVVTRLATAGLSAEDPPRIGADMRGTRKDVRIEDIVAAMGTRRPDASVAQKTFRQAFIYLVTQPRETADDIAKLERFRSAWETYFGDSTGGRGTVVARIR